MLPQHNKLHGTASLCFVLITTCNISYFVFELTICLLYHLQFHSVAAHAMHQQRRERNVCMHLDVNVSYVRYITCANNLLSSTGGTRV